MDKMIWRVGRVEIKIILVILVLGVIVFSYMMLTTTKTTSRTSSDIGEVNKILEHTKIDKDEEYGSEVKQNDKEIIRMSPEREEPSKLSEQTKAHKSDRHHAGTGQIEETTLKQSDTSEELKAQMELVRHYGDSYDKEAEDAAFKKLVEEYGEHEGVVKTVCDLADHSVESDPQKALDYYKYAMDNWMETAETMWAQSGLVKVNLALRKISQAEANYKALLSQFSEHENLPEAVYEVASAYQELDPERGLEILEYAMNRWPDYNKWTYANDSIIPLKNLVVLRILVGDEVGAQAAYEKLMAEFYSHENIPEAIFEIADAYGVTEPQKALELYEYAMNTWGDYNNWANSSDAIFHQMNIVLMKIELGDKEGAEAVCDNIMNNFSEDNNVGVVINELADAYMVSGEPEKALELYQYVEREVGEGSRGIWSDVALIKSDIMLGNDHANNEKVSNLVNDHLADPELGSAVFAVAQQYYREAFMRENEGDMRRAQEYFQKAGELYRTIIEKLPESTTSSVAIESRLLVGETYRRLGEPAKAIDYYEEVVTNWPDSGNAWHAQLMIGKSYDDLKRDGMVSRSEADAQIRNAYERLVQNYPDSPGAEIAAKWLDNNVK